MDIFSDYRFFLCLGALGVAIGEARYQLRSLSSRLDPEKITQWQRQQTLVEAAVREQKEDILELRRDLRAAGEAYTAGAQRLWTELEKTRERVAKTEGRLNGRGRPEGG